MATLEQVEKLREKTNVSYEEARAALDACNGDLLDALIYLEKQGRVTSPAGGGYYSSQNAAEHMPPVVEYRQKERCGSTFGDMMRKFGRFLAKVFGIGNTNFLVAVKNGEELFACPVTALVLLIIFFFWVVVPLFILSLFFGFRYHFRGNELGTENVNKAMDGATSAAEDIKKKP
jgi:hypothetical protein